MIIITVITIIIVLFVFILIDVLAYSVEICFIYRTI